MFIDSWAIALITRGKKGNRKMLLVSPTDLVDMLNLLSALGVIYRRDDHRGNEGDDDDDNPPDNKDPKSPPPGGGLMYAPLEDEVSRLLESIARGDGDW
jgi:hypothetical protein